MSNSNTLTNFGWQSFFQQQLSLEEWENKIPVRVIEQHRNELVVFSEQGTLHLPILPTMPNITVGDWLLLHNDQSFHRLLERKTSFARKAAGQKVVQQLIAANISTAFIITSANHDFNLNRLERFLSLVHEANVEPVVLISKCDLIDPDTISDFRTQVQRFDPFLRVETINATDHTSAHQLEPWLKAGETVVVLGSSGVGKSTLINTLLQESQQSTSGIREQDSKGKHTTTRRSILPLPQGGVILDTPGMRELQLSHCEEGLSITFADIEALAQQCRFKDCKHGAEPNCAVKQAVQTGELDPRHLNNYLKLQRENQLNTATLAERRQDDRAFGKMIKQVQQASKIIKGH